MRTIQINENSPARDLESAATSSTDDEYVYVMQAPSHIKQPTTTVWISQQPLDMLIDTGATVNLLDKNAHDRVQMMTKLEPTNKKILPYGKQHPLPLLGKLTTDVSAHGRTTEATFYVVQGNHGSLFSHTTALELGLIHVVYSADILQPTLSVTDQLMLKYQNITKGIGKLKNIQIKLHIDDIVKPVIQTHRRIPFHIRKKVEKELQLLEDQGIIEKVEGPTPWVSPIVAMPKPKNPEKIRICVDMRLPNQAVCRERHISPTVDDIIHDLNGAVMFSKLDLNSGYHQLELAPESRYITTFSTHVGLRKYTRLIFGISSAAEVFQNTIQQVLQGIPGVRNFSDDILVYGTTADAHNRSLEAVFQRLHENNLTINKDKCEFHKTSLEF